ncbi:MAG: glycoside hydrolase family 3 C-terminal domain-containing protein, partial [Bacteroidota bacterium]
MVDISRDPRWGRLIEAAGEDQYLGSLVASARVKGFQESNEDGKNVLACVKHFAGYGASLAGRDFNIQDFSERELREVHLPPFQAAIDAGVASLMCAYSAYDGEPLTVNQFLMQDVLRDEMGFKGLAMTDWETINNLVKTGVAENDTIATINAINAGLDLDMTSEKYVSLIPFLVENGKISIEQVDNAVRRVLMLKKKAGLLDDPFANLNTKNEKTELLSERNIAETKDIALKSMVLLKNDKNVLPISSDVKNIAVIGPMGKATKDLLGWWHCMGNEKDVVTYFDGISNKFENAKISFAKGCEIDSFRVAGRNLIPQAVKTAKEADVVILILGEEYWMSGEGGGVASLHLPGAQEELFEAIAKTGKPLITVINAGRPYILTDIDAKSDAILYAWMPGTTGGTALAEILSGEFNPQGKTPMTFPYHEGQVPIFYSYRRTSHKFEPGLTNNRYTTTYRDVQNEPLYPFGYGLSYTTYDYSDIKLSSSEMTMNDSITATVKITNSGKVKGTEVVQLYIGDKVCSVTRPAKELKDFTLVTIEPGETKTVTFEITPDKLTFIGKGKDYKRTIEKGEFNLFIGKNSFELQQTMFKLK